MTTRKVIHETIASTTKPRIAIIGGGAAGLACARVFSRDDADQSNNNSWSITVLEKDQGIGGVWNYREDDAKTRPMYRGLRTNLPKEIMAYREFPWPPLDDDDNHEHINKIDGDPSFLTHRQVQKYLEKYAKNFDLPVQFGCEVSQLTLLHDEDENPSCFSPIGSGERWPQVELTWREKTIDENSKSHKILDRKERFDAVLVANGHYSAARIPNVPGMLKHFANLPQKRVMHSIEYDNPKEFQDQTVLCIGGRASGSDIAREIAAAGAKHVYLSDSARTYGEPRYLDRMTWMPRTIRVLPGGVIEFDHNCPEQAKDVDAVIFCSGYDYSFPFINEHSGLELDCANRRVTPLYEQLWHAQYPHIAFVGLPHSILPFPFFEFQAEACLTMWNKRKLPSLPNRLQAAASATGGEGKENGRIEDTHYLGPAQWEYCRRMADYAEIYDKNIEAYMEVNKAIWDLSSAERKGEVPGGPDDYRESKFSRDHKAHSYKLLSSLIQQPVEGCVDSAALGK